MLTERLRENLKNWDFPLGPFNTEADLAEAMQQETDELGEAAANDLVLAILELNQGDLHLHAIYEFAEVYAKAYPQPFETALLQHMTEDGPPLLVELLGTTGSEVAVETIAEKIGTEIPIESLAVAVACAYGEIGGEKAREQLQALQQQATVPAVIEEINIALASAGRNGHYPA